mmetsp:Transcript_7314/g.21235  ORF Transcript_7314/g.21235 Transcript_7314/m.21235 type:complete len:82 (-) Transcript_7314:70-315(-)
MVRAETRVAVGAVVLGQKCGSKGRENSNGSGGEGSMDVDRGGRLSHNHGNDERGRLCVRTNNNYRIILTNYEVRLRLLLVV